MLDADAALASSGAGGRILQGGEVAQDAGQLAQRREVERAVLLSLIIPGEREFELSGLPLSGVRDLPASCYNPDAHTQRTNAPMAKPVIFTISAAWDDEASVWSGHCDDIPAAADAKTLDELLAKISAMALDVLPDNHPDIDPASLFLQITALREAEPVAA